jgi:ribonuclease Z
MHALPMLKSLALLASLAIGLPAWAFDGIRVTLLGGDAIAPSGEGPRGGILVEADGEVLLFDCAREVSSGLARAGLSVGDVTAVFLTRTTSTNLAGCVELFERSEREGRVDPWEIWGPAGTQDAVRTLLAGTAQAARVDANEIVENVVYQTDRVQVTALVAERVPDEPAFGYRVDFRQRAVVIAADNRFSQTLARFARNSAVLVHQVAVATPEAERSSEAARVAVSTYASPEDAARTFRAARPYLAVYAYAALFGATESDLIRRTRRHYPGGVEIGRDRMVIEIENEVQVRREPSTRRGDAR